LERENFEEPDKDLFNTLKLVPKLPLRLFVVLW